MFYVFTATGFLFYFVRENNIWEIYFINLQQKKKRTTKCCKNAATLLYSV